MDTRVLSQGMSSHGVKLTTHLHLELRLRMSTAIPLPSLCAFRAWIWTISPFTYLPTYYYLSKSNIQSPNEKGIVAGCICMYLGEGA
jgi:hypothetical protein